MENPMMPDQVDKMFEEDDAALAEKENEPGPESSGSLFSDEGEREQFSDDSDYTISGGKQRKARRSQEPAAKRPRVENEQTAKLRSSQPSQQDNRDGQAADGSDEDSCMQNDSDDEQGGRHSCDGDLQSVVPRFMLLPASRACGGLLSSPVAVPWTLALAVAGL